MKLEIRLFAGLRCGNRELPCLGKEEFYFDAPEGMSVRELIEILDLGPMPLVSVVNGVIVKKDHALSDGDRVGLFPPIAGG